MTKCDAILFGRSQRLVFREERERRRIEIGQQSSIERDTYEQRGYCELVTVVVVGATVLGGKLTPTRASGGALILAGILLHGWVRKPPRDRIAEKPRVSALRPAADSP